MSSVSPTNQDLSNDTTFSQIKSRVPVPLRQVGRYRYGTGITYTVGAIHLLIFHIYFRYGTTLVRCHEPFSAKYLSPQSGHEISWNRNFAGISGHILFRTIFYITIWYFCKISRNLCCKMKFPKKFCDYRYHRM